MSLNRSSATVLALCLALAPAAAHAGTYRVLHAFDPNSGDGESPVGLVQDSQGDLFGTTFPAAVTRPARFSGSRPTARRRCCTSSAVDRTTAHSRVPA